MVHTRLLVFGHARVWNGTAYRRTLVLRWKGRRWFDRRWSL